MSKLLEHAERELKLAGLDKPGSDFDGMLFEEVMGLMRAFCNRGHSGGSAHQTLTLFNIVARWGHLSPLTQDPAEWEDVTHLGAGSGGMVGESLWQNKRNPSVFSTNPNQEKTWYSVEDQEFGKRIFGGSDENNDRPESPDAGTPGGIPGN